MVFSQSKSSSMVDDQESVQLHDWPGAIAAGAISVHGGVFVELTSHPR